MILSLLIWSSIFSILFIQIIQYVKGEESNLITARINTFRRNDLLKSSISHYLTCNVMHEIQIIWSDLSNQPPSLKDLNVETNKVKFEVHDKDSLNNRFLPKLDIKTKVTLVIFKITIFKFVIIFMT